MPEQSAIALISLGILFLAGLVADQVGQRTHLPRVTLLLGCGLAMGGSGFDLLPSVITDFYEIVAVIALSMVAFLLGGALSIKTLATHGRAILAISIIVVAATLVIVSGGLLLLGIDPATALVLGAISTATAPAATFDVLHQMGVKNGFTETLKGIVAIDDAWGLLVFSVVIVLAGGWLGDGAGTGVFLTGALSEIGGSIGLGIVIGLPAAVLTGRLKRGEPLRVEALGLVFLTAGLAVALDQSYLIAGMTAGAIIVNLASHHTRAFHEIEHIQWPFMVMFFILAGATLEIEALMMAGPVGLAFVLLRIAGRMVGGWAGAALGGAPKAERPWFGPALLPQAGVAIGMALMAAEQLPGQAAEIMAIAIGSTVVFELIGPLAAALAVQRVARLKDDT